MEHGKNAKSLNIRKFFLYFRVRHLPRGKAAVSLLVIVLVAGTALITRSAVLAEQSGSSPSNNQTSRIQSLYNDLNGLSYGSDTNSPDWGSLWNRIATSAKWLPSGDVTANDVKAGKTFYNGSRAQQTGTYQSPGICSTQQYTDDYGNQTDNCTGNYSWTTPVLAVTGDDKMDPQTGLVWSQALYNNSGTVTFIASGSPTGWSRNGWVSFYVNPPANVSTGDTYTADGITFTIATTFGYANYYIPTHDSGTSLPSSTGTLTKVSGSGPGTITYLGVYSSPNIDLGNKTASQLCSERGNGWRLPTQKELMQAYIDGAKFNLSLATYSFIPSTINDSSSVYYFGVSLANGGSGYTTDMYSTNAVRCVRQP